MDGWHGWIVDAEHQTKMVKRQVVDCELITLLAYLSMYAGSQIPGLANHSQVEMGAGGANECRGLSRLVRL